MLRQSTTTKRIHWSHAGLVLAYFAAIVACWRCPDAPRWFWTVGMPALPAFVVAFGFHRWRRLCPLAAVAALGARLSDHRRRAPRWMDRWAPLLAFAALLAGLVVRHAMINGDHDCLGCALLVIAAAAVATNAAFSGRAWCNFLCPVGIVERIYTDRGALGRASHSRCDRCTGCKPSCPDIDQERAYRSGCERPATRIATFAFPGLVLAFYAYYWLRYGEWSAFFDGEWTARPFDRELWLGPGFTFAPAVPAVVACTLTLLVGAAASYGTFAAIERWLVRRVSDRAVLRHRMLALAAFVAFNLFYVFAGQPTLRRFPVLDRIAAFVLPVLATLVLARRWSAAVGGPASDRLPIVKPGPRGTAS